MAGNVPRKAPAIERSISEVTEDDILVRVIGTVKKPDESGFFLKDEAGEIRVEAQSREKEGDRVRVFARPTKINNELVLSSEIVQAVNSLNENIYKKIKTQGL